MRTKLAFEAPAARPGRWRPRFGFVDAVVTLTVMGAFAAELVLMAGQWLDASPGRSMQAVMTKIAPSTFPHVAAIPGPALGAGPRVVTSAMEAS